VPASEMVTQYHVLAAFQAITSVVWLLCAASAFTRYWRHRQRLELGWALAFAILALAHAIDGFVAYRVADEFGVLSAGPASILEFDIFYRVRVAAFVMVAAFVVLFLFRLRPVVQLPGEPV
jgi:hypothetical protein